MIVEFPGAGSEQHLPVPCLRQMLDDTVSAALHCGTHAEPAGFPERHQRETGVPVQKLLNGQCDVSDMDKTTSNVAAHDFRQRFILVGIRVEFDAVGQLTDRTVFQEIRNNLQINAVDPRIVDDEGDVHGRDVAQLARRRVRHIAHLPGDADNQPPGIVGHVSTVVQRRGNG
ncbi:hypothetical protein SDC9_183017 [bioreactor metagenome]|uniref:Uncharacterized protein n=1 Tax=bioreactor metagenome TaxID=1076179 RepID=A0A645HBM0_9ZZZZ